MLDYRYMQLQVQLLHPDATLPSFAHADDAGMDLFSIEEITIAPGERAQIQTGIAFAIPKGYVGLVWDKGGVSHKRGLKTLGGVFDAGYRGDLTIGLFNTSDTPQTFAVGDKIGQILIQEIIQPELVVVDQLEDAVRGTDRFGSTGK